MTDYANISANRINRASNGGMEIYLVGGAVRDELLGLPVTERDWVVVGATPADMINRGFKPVGNDFPVFLHPRNGEEYALARTERKSGHGYQGFQFHAAPDVTLEQDLVRRDLTINAMARGADGTLIDPHGGRRDLKARTLRHVSSAFTEDPLRVLRVARFAARYHWLGFDIHPRTLALMADIAHSRELSYLPPERIWKETQRALMEPSPGRFFTVLHHCAALSEVMAEIAALDGLPASPHQSPQRDALGQVLECLTLAAQQQLPLMARYALLCHRLGQGPDGHGQPDDAAVAVRAFSEHLRVPKEMRETAAALARWQEQIDQALALSPTDLLRLLQGLDSLRRPQRLEPTLAAATVCHQVRRGDRQAPFPQAAYLHGAAQKISAITGKTLLAKGLSGPALGQALEEQRVQALTRYREEFTH